MGDSNGNVLSGGLDELDSMKKALVELEKNKAQNAELAEKEEQLEKQISAMEKELSEKILSVTKSRKGELERAYDEQLEAIKGRQKKVRAKKDKLKSSKISERIEAETAELHEERKHIRDEIRGVYKSDKIPRVLNRSLFHAVYQPVGWRDILIIALVLVVILFAIPYGIYFIFFKPRTGLLVAAYIVTVLLFGAAYVFFGWIIKEKHPEAFRRIKELRRSLAKNRRDIRQMERGIRKDKDESGYGLDKFNQELSELENELDTIAEEKKKAVRKFETETKKVIADELTAECAGELGRLRREHEETDNAQRSAEEQIKSISMVITEKYSPYIGRENMDITLLEQLEQLLQSGEAGTVGEALGVYRSRRETTEQTRA